MQILLCKKSLVRLGVAPDELGAQLRERDHSPIVKDCLDRCARCEQGGVIAAADGMPLASRSVAQLLADVDALAADDE